MLIYIEVQIPLPPAIGPGDISTSGQLWFTNMVNTFHPTLPDKTTHFCNQAKPLLFPIT